MNDIIINKIQSIQRCVERAREEYRKDPVGFDTDYTVQDAAILNIVRPGEQAIDLANHIIKSRKMGIPTSSNESFDLLQRKQVIDSALANRLKNMVGFRNTVIHEYKRLDMGILKSVIESDLDDLLVFTDKVMESVDDAP